MKVRAPFWTGDPGPDLSVGNDEQGRSRIDPEPHSEISALADIDAMDVERVVIPSLLQDMRKQALDGSSCAFVRSIEEEQPRPRLGGERFCSCARQRHRPSSG